MSQHAIVETATKYLYHDEEIPFKSRKLMDPALFSLIVYKLMTLNPYDWHATSMLVTRVVP